MLLSLLAKIKHAVFAFLKLCHEVLECKQAYALWMWWFPDQFLVLCHFGRVSCPWDSLRALWVGFRPKFLLGLIIFYKLNSHLSKAYQANAIKMPISQLMLTVTSLLAVSSIRQCIEIYLSRSLFSSRLETSVYSDMSILSVKIYYGLIFYK